MSTITVYKWVNGCRVVRGEHKPHPDAARCTVREYTDKTLDEVMALELRQREAPEAPQWETGQLYSTCGYRAHATKSVQTPEQVLQHAGVDFFERNR